MVPAYIIAILQKRREKQYLTELEKEQFRDWFSLAMDREILFGDEHWEKDWALYLQFDADDQRVEHSLRRLYAAIGLPAAQEPVAEVNRSVARSDPRAQRSIRPSVVFLHRWAWAAASIVLLAVAVTIFLVLSSDRPAGSSNGEAVANSDVLPGKQGATLTLADGSQLVLDSLDNGVIALQSGSQVAIRDGELVYAVSGETAGSAVYNTMSTPKGRQFRMLLPDGTTVWLNAASSIRYPTVFTGKERKVEMQGEAYFEVAKNTKIPFRVNVNNKTEVEVLGTHFNVNAYENEASINTTLLEGSVRVNGTAIRPGQQIRIMPAGPQAGSGKEAESKVINDADIDEVMAWKNGVFLFNSADIETLMRQAERWYNIDVEYTGKCLASFSGEIARSAAIEDFLAIMSETEKVKFEIKGRKIIVTPL